ncbi:NADPH-dependent 2,4-dienoyl-CoA reductase/sulfur reductase-like enzyme/rhodanese-related sulfurtransferase [Desulfohalotomaculum tongense]|uniref:FAD-dependent oxidoreductase n=1 Tax=Desulforadius tongensis TaxID=1216062 RepID=UPI00195DE1D2|nr:FAD-dependent oxidoreductase [Desulforadius tongensis]MBM7855477.1 NADPH-dependent 2,4-dienoyl-CoA reductase/sulfur reductase-like enzyme/rhodanese-related sulfurtransferase [Desulforadius tongensis]
MGEKQKIVIIGGVAAGPKAAARARRRNPDAEIIMLERGEMTSYAGCGMPFFVSGMIQDYNQLFNTAYGVKRDAQYFGREKGVKLYTRTEAKAIDRDKKEVKAVNLETGEEMVFPYDQLVLATGASPVELPIEGKELKGVYKLNHPTDALKIKEALDTGEIERAVVIGAGLIGLEGADALFNKMVDVTIVELQEQVLPGMLDPDMAEKLQQHMREEDVDLCLGDKVLRIEGDENGNVKGVVTEKRGFIECQMVIMSVGVRPNVELAREAGLEIGKTGAIVVNDSMQTTDPYIYACGDCVENTHLVSGEKVYTPMATYANRQGRVVGDNLTGGNSTFKGVLGTGVAELFEMNVARTGLGEVQAKKLGYNVITALHSAFDRTHYHPAHGLMFIKVIADRDSKRILGAQAIGKAEVAKRIDVIATAITFGAKVDDLINIDLGYAPPFSAPIDPVVHTANFISNKAAGLATGISAKEFKEKVERGEDMVLLDVRTPEQFAPKHFKDDRVMQVTLGDLRERINEIPRDKEIITICAMGSRAYEAARILQGAGFKDVKILEGGYNAWPYELEFEKK